MPKHQQCLTKWFENQGSEPAKKLYMARSQIHQVLTIFRCDVEMLLIRMLHKVHKYNEDSQSTNNA
ncbi:hypothetical protein M8C21_007418, partial [Ambrosia artemisiifolia]